MSVKLVSDSAALLSMRDSDFDTYSAYGEAVDNAIQADAKNIRLKFDTYRQKGKRWDFINKVSFIDDGHGMDKELLHHCLQLGYSSRFNDRSGIGRFGVGMTLGAIHECKKIVVYSKTKTADSWYTTGIDISQLDPHNPDADVSIQEPKKVLLPEEYKEFSSLDSGTIVEWSEYDRQMESGEDIITETETWLGRTFRYFIWQKIKFFINGEEIKAIDPLYSRTQKTQFPDDPKAIEVDPIEFTWTPGIDVDCEDEKLKTVRIRLSLLPKEFRKSQGSGGTKEAHKRHIPQNQGVSILRNNREVFYDKIPRWPGTLAFFNEERSRFWGCEIHFNPVLDRAFTVKNIKRGAVPDTILKKVIHEKITPTVKIFLDEIAKDWKTNKVEQEKKTRDSDEPNTGHGPAEKIAGKVPLAGTPKPTSPEDAKKTQEELLERLKATKTEEEKLKWVAKWESQPYTIEEDMWKSPAFMELKALGGSDILLLNREHVFIEELFSLIDELESEDSSVSKDKAKELKCFIDLLLLSYNKATSQMQVSDKSKSDEYEEIFEQVLFNWGNFLKSYIRNWRQTNGK